MATVTLVLRDGTGMQISNVPQHEADEMQKNWSTPGNVFSVVGAHGVQEIKAADILSLGVK